MLEVRSLPHDAHDAHAAWQADGASACSHYHIHLMHAVMHPLDASFQAALALIIATLKKQHI